jgi:hypothetical protein
MNTKTIGEAAEAAIMSLLLNQGRIILKPFGDNQRYDLAIDNQDGTFSRIQIKTGRLLLKQGVISFRTNSQDYRGKCRSYTNDADYIAVYCRELDRGYLIKTTELPASSAYLRVYPAAYNRRQDVRNASDFEIPRIKSLCDVDLIDAHKQKQRTFKKNEEGRLSRRKFHASQKELKEQVDLHGYEATGRQFGVTGAAIKKRLRTLKSE